MTTDDDDRPDTKPGQEVEEHAPAPDRGSGDRDRDRDEGASTSDAPGVQEAQGG